MIDAQVLAHAPQPWNATSVLATYRPVSPLPSQPLSIHLQQQQRNTAADQDAPNDHHWESNLRQDVGGPRQQFYNGKFASSSAAVTSTLNSSSVQYPQRVAGRNPLHPSNFTEDFIVIGAAGDALEGLCPLPNDRKVHGVDLSLPVEQRLTYAKAHVDAKVMRLRREKELELERACTRSPCINAKSRAMANTTSFGDRLSVARSRTPTAAARSAETSKANVTTNTTAVNVTAVTDNNAQSTAEAPTTTTTNTTTTMAVTAIPSGEGDHKPHINERSMQMAPRGVAAQQKWEENRKLKQELLRAQLREEEVSETQRTPKINERSRAIHERVKVYKDPELLCLTVEERLLRAQKQRDEKLESERRGILAQEVRSRTPRRTATSGGPVSEAAADRLYLDAMERDRLQEERLRAAELLSYIDQQGEVLFQPKVNPTTTSAAQRKGDQTLYEYLSREKAESERTASAAKDAEQTHRPHIGPYSLLLATIAREDGVDTFDRLSKPRASVPTSTSPTRRSFSPTLNQRSVQMDAKKHAGAKRVDLLMQRQAKYERELELRQQQKKDEEDAWLQSTMQPWTRRSSESTAAGTAYASVGNVYERMHAWSQRSEAKLQAQRLEKERQELSDCTFQPVKTPA